MNRIDSDTEVFIIKTGQYETFAADTGSTFSLGDVLRTTALLPALTKAKKIHWLTDKNAAALLPTEASDFAVRFELSYLKQNIDEAHVLILNLERDPKLIPILQNKKNILGYIFNNEQWLIRDYLSNIYTVEAWIEHCASTRVYSWGAMLQKLVGPIATATTPIFKRPETKIISDIGFNWHVGTKWVSKKIGIHIWNKLEQGLQSKYKVSWQQGLNSVSEYASWVASNRLIISTDSLGLHLANGMDIPVIGLFGSTDYKLHDTGLRAHYINFDTPKDVYTCLPCWKSTCFQKTHCSEFMDFKTVYKLVDELLNEKAYCEKNNTFR